MDSAFDWAGDVAPRTTYADTVIYEVHVKGFTATHPGVPPELRGTYAGMAHPAAVAHLTSLGVTAVELLPVHKFITASAQARSGLSNYWGYNTIGFFAPHEEYSAAFQAGWVGGQVREFQQMVLALHAAGIEVILDVVYNHTAEGDQLGPTLCFRGIDNHAYYRLDPVDPSQYLDTTGTGNSYNVDDHTCLRLIMDSLRYWVTEMHVDGFRFDLATALAREDGGFERLSSVLRPRRPGPRDQPGEADRRAVGRRAVGQLQRGGVPGHLERVERPLSRHDPGVLAGARGRCPSWPPGSPGRRTSTGRPGGARTPRSTS